MTDRAESGADTRTLAAGAGVALVGRVGGRGAQVVLEIVLARLLGPLGFGLYATGWTVLRIVGLIAPFGLDRGVIRYGSRYRGADPARLKGVIFEALAAALASGLAAGAVLWFGADGLAVRVWGKPELAFVFRGLAPAVALFAALRVAAATTRLSQRTGYAVASEDLARPLANLAFVGIATAIGWRLGGALVAASLAFGLAFLLAVCWIVRLFPVVRDPTVTARRTGGALFRFSATASVSGIAILLLVWIDRLLLSVLRPAAEVGIYQAATQPAFVFSTILVSFNAILVPMIADLAHREQWARLAELYRISTKWGVYLGLPLFLVLLFRADVAIEAVFGGRYLAGAVPMVILSAGQMVNAGTGAVGPLLIMTGHARRWMLFTATMLVVAVALNLALIPRWGMQGAAIATSSSVAAMFLGGVVQVRAIHGFWPYDRRYWKGLAAAGAAAAALAAVGRLGPASGALALALAVIVAGGAFAAVLLATGLDAEDRELLELLRGRLRRRGGGRP